ncbi:sigma-70 family RNA polymerase sigma factor [Xanthomonas prunicola]|jgi:RNA polymerase sigma factor for flagellar operon FliA|uniref:RNA polymerase subunit sigma-70 n=1 Tax=Xanthomonas prunicola TaxID=2053930 RepID=A0A2N3RFG3_9XANT|nr:sigma-70 family RNA polymerase sigma factor [Xanthomonas prunicola]PKV11245.1 RNA polymerase subunit sigma-70 [Xanthomonas prunicola]PKV15453.1 RNA polymerase subunit sigma-70 [Xanthomonas prunicola]PKV19473.1 RNA polymerase subunit sigma-70 [Xanthomonas prunicola]
MDREALVAELWRRFKADHDLQARDFLVTEYSPWARLVAADVYRRIGRRDLDWADHLQNAHVGMLEAMTRYDPSRAIPFTLYAKRRVRGAVFNGVRQQKRSSRAEDSIDVVADDTGGLEGFIGSILEIATQHLVEHATDAWPGRDLAEEQARGILAQAMLQLAPRTREIFMSHYYLHKPFVQIAGELGVTKGRVSQLHSQGLGILRAQLNDGCFQKGDFL